MNKLRANSLSPRGFYSPELGLVLAMLLVLLLLVSIVLLMPTKWIAENITDGTEILEYRINVLSLIITAFGAWVGAGAAYFFGRENLKVAAESLLAMRDPSPRERLINTPIRQFPLMPLTWKVKETDKIKDVRTKLDEMPQYWFIPIVKEDGNLSTVIEEEVLLRFLVDKADVKDIDEQTVKSVLDYLQTHPKKDKLSDRFIRTTLDTNVGAINDMMEEKDIFLAIVEDNGKPTHYFTTSEIRKFLLKE